MGLTSVVCDVAHRSRCHRRQLSEHDHCRRQENPYAATAETSTRNTTHTRAHQGAARTGAPMVLKRSTMNRLLLVSRTSDPLAAIHAPWKASANRTAPRESWSDTAVRCVERPKIFDIRIPSPRVSREDQENFTAGTFSERRISQNAPLRNTSESEIIAIFSPPANAGHVCFFSGRKGAGTPMPALLCLSDEVVITNPVSQQL